MINNTIAKLSLFVFALAVLVAPSIAVHAATDSDLAAAFASSTSILTDNKSAVIGYVATFIGITTLVALAFAGMRWGKGQVVGLLARRKGRKK